jgi:hypothetical protein
MSNKDLLKQAIAEAKTIREAAIANAKEALEETLTPHLKDMLAAKLQEMEDKEDEEVMDENIYEAEEEEVEAEEGDEQEEETEETEEDVDVKDMSVEELKDLIRDIVAQETGIDQEAEMEAGEETPEGEEDMVSMDGEEEIDINELLAELAEEEDMEEGLKDTFKKVGQKVKDTQDKFDSFITKTGEKIHGGKGLGTGTFQTKHQNETVDLDESLADEMKALAAKYGEKFDQWITKTGKTLHGGKGLGAGTFQSKHQNETAELEEALATVETLRGQLQEVNLLNAKLLYVNKVFKSNNLTESQKVNVIAAFDKAETVREAKLVFETVSKNVVAKPASIKEHRSFASKATGNANTTAPKEILAEVDEQVQRWQKLAGIIKS